ncbi:hypothetical protein [Spiroplasma endosymbiont of Polydrusus pterygomalis]
MKKNVLNYPHDISKKLLMLLGISKIIIGLSILLFIIAHSIAYPTIN